MRKLPVVALALVGCSSDPSSLGDTSSEVIGGSAAPAGKWPDVAAVMFNGAPGCTGTLIAPDLVLTAGHCNDTELTSVLVGTHTLAEPETGETIAVRRRMEYPSSQATLDITLLELATPSTKPPRAIATGWARFDLVDGAAAAIVGYGAVDQNANEFVDELQEAMTTITDADCTAMPGCNVAAKPSGELGAGGMGIDTCPGDSGGPLYLVTSYGTFLAGVTSRAYDDAQLPCRDGGIYARPDKIVSWLETMSGSRLSRGPEPQALPILAVRGHRGDTQIVHGDPIGTSHTYTVKTAPKHGTFKLLDDGRLRVCASPDMVGTDEMIVSVTDAMNAKRSLDVTIAIEIQDGAPPTTPCSLDADAPGDPDDDGDGDGGDGDGDGDGDAGGCATTPDGTSWLVLGLVLVGLQRRRRRWSPTSVSSAPLPVPANLAATSATQPQVVATPPSSAKRAHRRWSPSRS